MKSKKCNVGFELNGWKLGERVVFYGRGEMIIGFDTSHGSLICITYDGEFADNLRVKDRSTHFLKGYGKNTKNCWVNKSDVKRVDQ